MPAAVALALGVCAACTAGAKASSSTGGSTASTGIVSSITGGTSGTSGGRGTSGDAGCAIGSPNGLQEGSVCLFAFDCGCDLVCGSDVSGASGNLVCEYPCAIDSDCPLAGEHCQTTLGFCQGGMGGSCAVKGSPNLEFYNCGTNSDCPCPLECYGDPVLGAVCEHPCDTAHESCERGR